MKYVRWFLREVKPYGWTYAFVLLLQVVMVALALSYVWLGKELVDVAVAHFNGVPDGSGRLSLASLAAVYVVLSMARPVIAAAKSYCETKMAVGMSNSLRQRLFENLLHLKNEYTRKYHSGDMLNRLQVDVISVSSAFCSSIPNLFWAAVQFVAAFAYILTIDVRLAWILALIVPVAIVGGRYVTFKVRDLTLDIRRSDSSVQSHIQESFQHLTLLQSLEYTGASIESLDNLQSENFKKNMTRSRFSVLARSLIGFSFTIGYAVAFLWAVFGISKGTVTYGLMTAILQLVGQVQRPLVQASDQLPSVLRCTASIDRLEEIASLPRETAYGRRFIEGVAGIRIENLSFRYSDGRDDVLTDFSFDFAPGSKTAIVGPTGIGKSTLIRLMLSLLTPTKGSISLYNSSESVPASEATRCNLVYVPQGNTLFSGTVKENLQMGDPDADEESMKEALQTAAADFVLELPQGLDTPCFEAGGGFSEGQAQRIAIARALLRPGSILLLDEFSSALDSETEELLLQRLTSSRKGRTMIFITHRERIIDFCDATLRLS